MALSGFYGGYLQALQTISGVESQRVQREQTLQHMAIQQDEWQRQGQERDILAQVFRAQGQDQMEMGLLQQDNLLAQQYKQAGRALMGVNPKDAMGFLEAGTKQEMYAQDMLLRKLRVEDAKGDLVGAIAGGVTDQVSLDAAKDKLATLGVALPSKFGMWNEVTQQYMEGMQAFSIPAHQQRMLKIRELTARATAQAKEQKAKLDEEKLQQKARMDAGKQIGKALKPATRVVTELEMEMIGQMPGGELFAEASPAVQAEAAARIRHRAATILEAGDAASMDDALELARGEVVKEYEGGGMGKTLGIPNPFADREPVRLKKGQTQEETAPAQSELAAAVTKAGIPYEPEKYEYMVQGNKILRRAKR